MILSIDPGKANGYAKWKDTGEFMMMGQLVIEDIPEFLAKLEEPVSVVVVEDYIIFSKRAKQQAGSNVPAARVIGALELFAAQKGAKLVKQDASILTSAQKIANMKMPSDHSVSHQISAYLHGYHYLVKNGLRHPWAAEKIMRERAQNG